MALAYDLNDDSSPYEPVHFRVSTSSSTHPPTHFYLPTDKITHLLNSTSTQPPNTTIQDKQDVDRRLALSALANAYDH